MSSSDLKRWGAPGTLLAAIAWTISGVIAFVLVQSPASNMGPTGSLSWYLIESSDAIAELGMLAALVGLHFLQAPRYGWLGTAGFAVAFVGTASLLLSTVIWLLTAGAEGAFLDILFSLGGLAVLVGFPLLGVATFRADVLPRWCSLLLIAWIVYFPLIFMLVDFYGEARALFGLVFLALGYALWSRTGAAARHPSCVS
ncbi:MAG: hypothetical protein M3N10_00330 [Actinomycetota bacterium]|nr:hypothetical protein [Actinomycetota bacterium]HZY65744.1 hypothetical protein [Rubrobacteraceae bacterium]